MRKFWINIIDDGNNRFDSDNTRKVWSKHNKIIIYTDKESALKAQDELAASTGKTVYTLEAISSSSIKLERNIIL